MKNFLRKTLVIAIGAVFLLPFASHAYQDNYVLNSATFTLTDNQKVGIKYTQGSTTTSETTWATTIKVKLSNNGQALNGGDWFDAFCVDVYQNISATTYNKPVTMVTPSAVHGGLQAAWLYEHYYSKTADAATISALQVAIWEVVVDDYATPNLSAGKFAVTSLNSTALTKANNFLNDLRQNYSAGSLNSLYAIMQSGTYQDQLIKFPLPGVISDPGTPEPATLVLMGIGLLGLAGFRKFRKN